MTPFTISILLIGSKTPVEYSIVYWEAHTYGFLELRFTDGHAEQHNLARIQSFSVPTPVSPAAA